MGREIVTSQICWGLKEMTPKESLVWAQVGVTFLLSHQMQHRRDKFWGGTEARGAGHGKRSDRLWHLAGLGLSVSSAHY